MDSHPVTFELSLPPDFDADDELFEDIQSGAINFESLMLEAVVDMDSSEIHVVPGESPQPATDVPANAPNSPRPSTTTCTGRFKSLNDQEFMEIEKNQYSSATKKNTKWGIRAFNAWCADNLQFDVDLNTVSASDLNQYLRKFYAETQPKQKNSSLTEDQAQEYHKNTMKNVRGAINRHLKDIGRQMDFVRDTDFKQANSMLTAKLKLNLKNGTSRPTQHHKIISNDELAKINEYLQRDDPIALRLRVWYLLAIHFVSRGVEFHHQLTRNSLQFEFDHHGVEYLTISHETQQKNHQGGLSARSEESNDKRMYSTPDAVSCPIEVVKRFLDRTDSSSTALFNHINKDAMHNPNITDIWYTSTPVKVKQFSNFMPEICKNSGVQRYTGHSLRATAITALSDAGFTDRSIMYMSDHKREESLQTYCRRPSSNQKEKISSVLENIATGHAVDSLQVQSCQSINNSGSSSTSAAVNTNQSIVDDVAPINRQTPSLPTIAQSQQINEMSKMHGFATNSMFQNCTFHFH